MNKEEAFAYRMYKAYMRYASIARDGTIFVPSPKNNVKMKGKKYEKFCISKKTKKLFKNRNRKILFKRF